MSFRHPPWGPQILYHASITSHILPLELLLSSECCASLHLRLSLSLPLTSAASSSRRQLRQAHSALPPIILSLSFQDALFFSGGLCAADRRPSRGLSHRQGTSGGPGHENCPKVLHHQHGMLTPCNPFSCRGLQIDVLFSLALRQISGMRTCLAVAWVTFWLSTFLLLACLCCSPMCTAQRIIKFARSLLANQRSMLPAPSPRWSCPTSSILRPRTS